MNVEVRLLAVAAVADLSEDQTGVRMLAFDHSDTAAKKVAHEYPCVSTVQ
jgi:hypothetical protein